MGRGKERKHRTCEQANLRRGERPKIKVKVTGFRLGGRNDVKFKSGERKGAEAHKTRGGELAKRRRGERPISGELVNTEY